MPLLKMMRTQARLGVPLPWSVREPDGTLLMPRGQIIEDQEQLDALLSHGACVDSDEVKAAMAAGLGRHETPVEARPDTLLGLWEKVLFKLERALKGMAEEPGFGARMDELAQHLVGLIERDADLGIYLAVRQDKRRYSIYGLTHAVYCAMICFLLSRRMAWPRERCMTLVKAALTMNAATLELQGRMAAQGVAITPEQKAIVRQHPLKSAQMLREAGVQDAEWLEAVAQHHEHADGLGYPAGLTQVSEMAHALRLADVFLAKISPRAMRPTVSVQDAARQLFKDDAGGPVAMAIIKEFGIYPPGEFVKLKSGESAVVLRRSEGANTPIAASVTDRTGMPMVNTIRRDTAKADFAIVGIVADKTLALRVPPERLYGL